MEAQTPNVGTLAGEPLEKYELELLQTYLKNIRAECGSDTPVEKFIDALVANYRVRLLTVEWIEDQLNDLKRDLEGCISIAARLCRQYPKLVKSQLPEGSIFFIPSNSAPGNDTPAPKPEIVPKESVEDEYQAKERERHPSPAERAYRKQLRRDIEFNFSGPYIETATLAYVGDVLNIWQNEP